MECSESKGIHQLLGDNMKIAIIGSRNFKRDSKIIAFLNKLKWDYTDNDGMCYLEIVTGGAIGVDKIAENWCKNHPYPIPCDVIRPINPSDKFSYLLRNVEILTKADKVIAFWDGGSRGTKFGIDYAKARNKPIEVILQ